jgi:hypothetical protein
MKSGLLKTLVKETTGNDAEAEQKLQTMSANDVGAHTSKAAAASHSPRRRANFHAQIELSTTRSAEYTGEQHNCHLPV